MSRNIFNLLFIIIFAFGVFLRFYQLGEIPSSLDWDEVSQGYNSYSILKTGKDEYGNFLPSVIRSFNDYKPPIYVYLSIVPISIFGLNEFSERFASAFFGSISMLFVFGLVYEVFRKEKFVKYVSLLSMLFFAISPYSIQFSRTAFDANVGVFLVVLGAYLFLRGLNNKSGRNLYFGTFFLAISVYSAHSEKVFAPLFFIFLVFFGRKYLFRRKILIIGLFCLFGFINLFWFFNPQTRARSSGVIFTSSQQVIENSTKKLIADKDRGDQLGSFIHNRRFVYLSKYVENYLTHFDLNYLFVHGDVARHHAPQTGILYLISLPLIILGMYFIFKNKLYSGAIIFVWMIIAPAASSFAIDPPNFQRSLIFLPSFHVFEALGAYFLVKSISKLKYSKIFTAILIIAISLNVIYYLHQHFAYTNFEYGKYWQQGYKEAINYVKEFEVSGKKIFFANNMEQGYMFYLFHRKYDPQKFLSKGGSNIINIQCYNIDSAYFGVCKDKINKGDIFVTSKGLIREDYKLLNIIRNEYGEPIVWVLERT